MKLTFIRHAESYNNYMYFLHRTYQKGVIDPALSEMGEKQAQALANFLAKNQKKFSFDHIYISPYLRTLQTAEAFAHLYPDTPKMVWMWIHEGGGCYEVVGREPLVTVGKPGMARSQIKEQFPAFQISDEITEEGWYLLSQKEPESHRYYRANTVIEHLIQQFGETDAHIALVSHGAFFNYLLSAIEKRTMKYKVWYDVENTSISEFTYNIDPGGEDNPNWWVVKSVNRHEWLGEALTRDWRIDS